MEGPQKVQIELPYNPEIPTSGYLSEENKNTKSEGYMQPLVHCSIIFNKQDMETI